MDNRPRYGTKWRIIHHGDADPFMEDWHLRGLWVRNNETGELRWEVHLGCMDPFLEEFVDANGNDFGWVAEDYEMWAPLPEPPPRFDEEIK